MSTIQEATAEDAKLAESILDRVGADLGMIIDRSVRMSDFRTERADFRVSGEGSIHISFRLGVRIDGMNRQGCMLLPLAEAVAVGGFLMMMSDEDVLAYREKTDLDTSMKEALLEVGNFIAGACDAVLRSSLPDGSAIRSEGCQGVRDGVRPALEYDEGEELLVGRAQGQIDDFPPFEAILMLPELK